MRIFDSAKNEYICILIDENQWIRIQLIISNSKIVRITNKLSYGWSRVSKWMDHTVVHAYNWVLKSLSILKLWQLIAIQTLHFFEKRFNFKVFTWKCVKVWTKLLLKFLWSCGWKRIMFACMNLRNILSHLNNLK